MKKIIALILAIMFSFSLFACDSCKKQDKEEEQQQSSSQEQKENENEKEIAIETDKYVIEANKSNYSILLPTNASEDLAVAAAELKVFLFEATGAELEIVRSTTKNGRYFSLGETQLYKEQDVVSADFNVLTSQGFGIKTIDENIYIYAATDLAVIYGVYGYLERAVNYDFFYTDVYTIDKVDNLKLFEYDIVDIPNIEYRVCSYGYQAMNTTTRRRLKLVKYDDCFPHIEDVSMWHNCFTYISPEEYSNANFFNVDKNQLCYTAHGNDSDLQTMLNIISDKMVDFFSQDTSANEIILALNDYNTPCKCDACERDKNNYGTYSSSLIKFLNRLAPIVEQKLNQAGDKRASTFRIVFYAYFYLEDAPVVMNTDDKGNNTFSYSDEMVLSSHVAPLLAPFYAYYTKGINDEANKQYHDNFLKWNVIADNMHLWYYDVYFREGGYMAPFDTFTQVAELYQLAYENDFCFTYAEGQTSNRVSSAFTILKGYLESKLGWNVYADVNTLIQKYFDAMYGSESTEMRKIFDEMRVLWNKQTFEIWERGGFCHAINLFTKEAYPLNLTMDWFNRMEAVEQRLIAKGETKQAENVRIEIISPLYIIIRVHADSFADDDIYSYKVKLKNYLNQFSITHLSQDVTSEYYIGTLGI